MPVPTDISPEGLPGTERILKYPNPNKVKRYIFILRVFIAMVRFLLMENLWEFDPMDIFRTCMILLPF